MTNPETNETLPSLPEIHHGVVLTMEEDYSETELIHPSGLKYRRSFETPFMTAIGIKARDHFQLEFEEKVIQGVGTITMRVRGLGPQIDEEIDPEFAKIKKEAEFMGNIRRVFGSLIYDSRNRD